MAAPTRILALTAAVGVVALATALVLNFRDEPPAPGVVAKRPDSSSANSTSSLAGDPGAAENPVVVKAEPPAAVPTERPPTVPVANGQPSASITPPTSRADYQPPPSKYKNARNPIARKALAGVGADPESERVWLEAINDPNLPANERQDLIEDLNEDGISNPAKPTQRDLPLIRSRISLIEQLTPTAMDQTNAAAFKEAHKDLVNMVDRLGR